jgi:hypothetical protein
LHTYAVQKVYLALTKDITQQILVRVAVWCIGEFGDLLISSGNQGLDGENISVTGNAGTVVTFTFKNLIQLSCCKGLPSPQLPPQ